MTLRAPVPASEKVITVYPVASAGVASTAGAANTYSAAFSELVALAGIAVPYRVVGVLVCTPAVALDTGTVAIYENANGVGESLVLEVPYEFATDAGTFVTIPVFSKTIPAGSRLSCKIKGTTGGTTAAVRVQTQPV
jgi:hypothetical protein